MLSNDQAVYFEITDALSSNMPISENESCYKLSETSRISKENDSHSM